MIASVVCGVLVFASALAARRAAISRRTRHEALKAAAVEEPAVPAWFSRRAEQAAIPAEAHRVWVLWLAGFPAGALLGYWIGGAGCAALLATTWAAAPVVLPPHLARRAAAKREEAVPAALDTVARALRSGASLLQALDEAAHEKGALQGELQRLVVDATRGAGVAAALDKWAERQPSGSIRLAAAALSLGAETGGANARAVDGVASTVRQRLAVLGEARALTAQPRVSAQVIGLAPIAFGAFSAATDPDLARMLFTTPVGWAMLVAGLTLDLLGMGWMMRMARG